MAALFEQLLDKSTLTTAFFRVRENKGCAGADNMTIQQFERHLEFNLHLLINELGDFCYNPRPYVNFKIHKDHGKTRKLAIPAVRDRVIQAAIAQLVLPLFELEFEKCSFGYRPNRSYKDAVQSVIDGYHAGYHYVIDADLQNYFDSIPQQRLLLLLADKLRDQDLVNLIQQTRFTKQSKGKHLMFGEKKGLGIPQGSPLSPVLANYYLDSFDEMLLTHDCHYVRYADDFVVLTKTKEQAQSLLKRIKQSLTFLNLSLNVEKTQITEFSQGFKFLGHQFIDDMVIEEKLQTHFTPKSTDELTIPAALQASDEKFASHQQFNPTHQLPTVAQLWGAQPDADNELNTAYKITTAPKLKTVYVTQQGCVLQKRKGKLVVNHNNQIINSIPLQTIDMIIIMGRCQLTTDCYTYCLQHQIAIYFTSYTGALYGQLQHIGTLDANLIEKQINYLTPERNLSLTKRLIKAKIKNTFVAVNRLSKTKAIKQTAEYIAFGKQAIAFQQAIEQATDIESIRGYEGHFAKNYFAILKQLIAPDWLFNNRNRQPPKDPVNVLLSLGYTVLYANVNTLITTRGLLTSKGFFHRTAPNKPTLVLDLMEQFRAPIVDAVVLNLVLNGGITLQHFTFNHNECTFSATGRKLFFNKLEQKFNAAIQHPFEQGKTDYRRLFDIHALWLKRNILSANDDYQPLRLR